MSGLIWVQTVCKGYQQTTLEGKKVKDFFHIVTHILSTSLTFVTSGNPCPVEIIQIYPVIRNTVNPGQPASRALFTSTTDDLHAFLQGLKPLRFFGFFFA